MASVKLVKYSRLKDWLERTGWTILQAGAGVMLDQMISGRITWHAILYAGAIAGLKVVIAQRVGSTPTGELIPGGIAEVEKQVGP